jgi:hypothetical protein
MPGPVSFVDDHATRVPPRGKVNVELPPQSSDIDAPAPSTYIARNRCEERTGKRQGGDLHDGYFTT